MMWKPNTDNEILICAGQLMIGCQTLRFTFSDIRIWHRYLIGWDHLGRCCSCTEVRYPGLGVYLCSLTLQAISPLLAMRILSKVCWGETDSVLFINTQTRLKSIQQCIVSREEDQRAELYFFTGAAAAAVWCGALNSTTSGVEWTILQKQDLMRH